MALAATCRFHDCRHDSEPGCAIRAGIDSGEVDPSRLKRWQKLAAEDAFNSTTLAERRAKDKVDREEMPDVVLLDIMMPGMDGFEALRRLRTFSQVPVLVLTAKDDEEDRIKGLELGADDYVGKPFSHRELVSRIRAVLRRHYTPPPTPQTTVRVDDRLTIDFARREAIERPYG